MSRSLDRTDTNVLQIPDPQSDVAAHFVKQYHTDPIRDQIAQLLQDTDKRDNHNHPGFSPEQITERLKAIEEQLLVEKSDSPATGAIDFLQACSRLQSQSDPSYRAEHNLAHLLHGRHTLVGLMGKLQGTLMQGNQVCHEVAAFAHACEQRLITLLLSFMGYAPDGSAWALPTVGGSEANILALLAARERFFKLHTGLSVATCGLATACAALPPGVTPMILLPESAHYCWEKAARSIGLGQGSLIKLPVDARQRLCPLALRGALATHTNQIMACVSIFGATEFGGIDPIDQIDALLAEHEQRTGFPVWHHIDAAMGAPAVRQPAYRHLQPALCAADSVTVDPHKLLFSPYNCGALIIREPGWLTAIQADAPYISHYGEGEFCPDAPGRYRLNGSLDSSGILAAYYTLSAIPWTVLDTMVAQCCEQAKCFASHLAKLSSTQSALSLVSTQPDLLMVGSYWTGAPSDEVHTTFHRDMITRLHTDPAGFRISTTLYTITLNGTPRLVHRFCFMHPELSLESAKGMAEHYWKTFCITLAHYNT